MNVFAEENDMRLRMHHWANGKPKMIQPKKDGPDPVGLAVAFFAIAILTAFSLRACGQSVVWSFPVDACPQPAIILAPCDPSGLALCLYPVNPGGTMAGSNLYADPDFACSDGGLVYQGTGDETGLMFGIVSFGEVTITEVVVEYDGDPPVLTSDHGEVPFEVNGAVYFTIHNSGTTVIHSITVTAGVVTDIHVPAHYESSYPPRPQVYHEVDGRLAPFRFNRKPIAVGR